MTARAHRVQRVAVAVLVALAAAGLLAAAAGFVPIGARGGHWAVTRAALEFVKRRAVDTRSSTVGPLELQDPWLAVKGAGHYEVGCRPCHGGPGTPVPRIAAAMLPPPPPLSDRVSRWEDEELFYIVKHGLKFTGMPAWPASGRDDEVRAVVAFLRELPGLDEDAYRLLATGEPLDGRPAALSDFAGGMPDPSATRALAAERCAACHGADGRGREGRGRGAFPRLAGQSADYLENALQAYAEGARHSGIMEPLAASLDPLERRQLAAHFAALPGSQPGQAASAPTERSERGRAIAERGAPEQGIPSCADCHGPGPGPRNDAYPRLDGQPAEYLELQLVLFSSGRRGGSAFAHLMDHVASRLNAGQRRDVAEYYAGLDTQAGP